MSRRLGVALLLVVTACPDPQVKIDFSGLKEALGRLDPLALDRMFDSYTTEQSFDKKLREELEKAKNASAFSSVDLVFSFGLIPGDTGDPAWGQRRFRMMSLDEKNQIIGHPILLVDEASESSRNGKGGTVRIDATAWSPGHKQIEAYFKLDDVGRLSGNYQLHYAIVSPAGVDLATFTMNRSTVGEELDPSKFSEHRALKSTEWVGIAEFWLKAR